jgi:two-component system, NtrC family, sensor kinase
MLDIQQVNAEAVSNFGRSMLNTYRGKFGSFEEAAQQCVTRLFEEFRQDSHTPSFALVRVYRLCTYDELLPELQANVDSQRERWMALMGTVGIESAWCDRQQSQGHKALNLGADQSPMVSAAIYQIGLDLGIDLPNLEIELPVPEATLLTRYFHIPQALGSKYIPAQTPFVQPYNIQSVVGVGSAFVSNSAYLLLAFSKVEISVEAAQNFAQLAPFMSTLLATYDQGKIWA